MTQEKLLTVKQIAEWLQLSEETVRRFIRDGKIHAIKAGRSYRVTEQDVLDYLKKK